MHFYFIFLQSKLLHHTIGIFTGLTGLIEFAESIILKKTIHDINAGVSYQFKMDKFFEELVLKMSRMAAPLTTKPQYREEFLGKSYWTSDDEILLIDRIKNDMSARPDIYLEMEKNIFILECKYKPFKIPHINDLDSSKELSSFESEDRNQLLSFLISLAPSAEMVGKKIHTAVIFPCRSVADFKCSSLVFLNAKFKIDNISKNISQIRSEVDQGNRLEIKFVGINVQSCIIALAKRDVDFVKNILNSITGLVKIETSSNHKSAFNQALDKRISLASYIIDNSKNDKTLGRTKLAKVIYLADAHLKLDLMGQYQRQAAGPYDPRMFRNEKIGIEEIADRNGYFHVINQPNLKSDNERVRYIPSVNISHMVTNAKRLFYDKQEELDKILDLFSKLNTEQSEIVATLYACWNDLLKNGKPTTNDVIITDFRENWHESKKRFEVEKLNKALEWMRIKGLIPDGNASQTIINIREDIPSGF